MAKPFHPFAIFLALLFCLSALIPSLAQTPPTDDPEALLPPPQVHPLPSSLQQWPTPINAANPNRRDNPGANPGANPVTNPGVNPDANPGTTDNSSPASHALDYFDRIQPSRWGYLIWSQFPITVYIEPISSPNLLAQNQSPPEQSAQAQRQITWYQTVLAALDAWQPYLPLTVVDDAETANIIIRRSAPALQRNEDGSLGRARSAETRYQISLAQASPPPNSPLPNSPPQAFLAQQFTILLSDRQAPTYLQNTACHEIGHALGLWGHSLDPADVMYGVQTHQPAAISDRDVNTLKRLYQQPTRLGWSFNPALPPE